MTDERARRGEELCRRRTALGIYTVSDFARRTGKNRDTIAAAEAGKASASTYLELETWLTTAEEHAAAMSDMESEMVEFDVTGPRTEWHFVVRGPAEQADNLRRQVVELLKDIESVD